METIRQPTGLILSAVAEVTTVVGLVSSIISILEIIQTIHHAIKDVKCPPQGFRQVAQKRPLAQGTLRITEGYMKERTLQSDDCEAMRPIVDEYKNRVDNSKKVFQNVEAPPDASRLQHYGQPWWRANWARELG